MKDDPEFSEECELREAFKYIFIIYYWRVIVRMKKIVVKIKLPNCKMIKIVNTLFVKIVTSIFIITNFNSILLRSKFLSFNTT